MTSPSLCSFLTMTELLFEVKAMPALIMFDSMLDVFAKVYVNLQSIDIPGEKLIGVIRNWLPSYTYYSKSTSSGLSCALFCCPRVRLAMDVL